MMCGGLLVAKLPHHVVHILYLPCPCGAEEDIVVCALGGPWAVRC
jgi:hypothetical protein